MDPLEKQNRQDEYMLQREFIRLTLGSSTVASYTLEKLRTSSGSVYEVCTSVVPVWC